MIVCGLELSILQHIVGAKWPFICQVGIACIWYWNTPLLGSTFEQNACKTLKDCVGQS